MRQKVENINKLQVWVRQKVENINRSRNRSVTTLRPLSIWFYTHVMEEKEGSISGYMQGYPQRMRLQKRHETLKIWQSLG